MGVYPNNPEFDSQPSASVLGADDPSAGHLRILDILEPFETVDAYATVAAIPGALAMPAGHSAWFGLVHAAVGDDVADELVLQAARMTMLPTNPAGLVVNGEAVPLTWGTDLGLGAAVVLGMDLPIKLGEWTTGPVYLPGVEVGADIAINGKSRYLDHWGFPPGQIGTAPIQKQTVPGNYAPNGHRIIEGDRLCVALVVRGASITAGLGNNWSGLIDLRLQLGVRTPPRKFH